MTQDFEVSALPPVLQNLAELMAGINEQVVSEQRQDLIHELHDSITYERQQFHWWQRLNSQQSTVSLTTHANHRISHVVPHHACSQFLVVTDGQTRFVVPTSNVKSLSNVPIKASTDRHADFFCGDMVLMQLARSHERVTIVQQDDSRFTATLVSLWRDAIDVDVNGSIETIALAGIEWFEVPC